MSEAGIRFNGMRYGMTRHFVALQAHTEGMDSILEEVITDLPAPGAGAPDLVRDWCPSSTETIHSRRRMVDDGCARYSAVLRLDDAVVSLAWEERAVEIHLFSAEGGDPDHPLFRTLRENLHHHADSEEEATVPVLFWRWNESEVASSIRDLRCPTWAEIQGNYPPAVREGIDELVTNDAPEALGKIILWHGEPGVGKTYAIRALAREWTERLGSTVEVVLDHEVFFESATYLHEVLLADGLPEKVGRRIRRRKQRMGWEGGDPSTGPGESTGDPLRLVVIEDGASLFSVDCRQREGFARFLNVSEGIAGQGIRSIFLVTANEPIEQIDPAVHRPGRCIQELHFEKFCPSGAREWLERKGGKELGELASRNGEGVSLAELYAHLHGQPVTRGAGSQQARFGFRQ